MASSNTPEPTNGVKIAHEANESKGVDTDRYSRVLPIMGAGNIKKLMEMSVLVSGMLGLGAEVAKNLILSGVGNVTIHDTEKVKISDLSANFYLTKEDVGKNRAEACVERFAELNPYTSVTSSTSPLSRDMLSKFKKAPHEGKNVVVITNNRSLELLKDLGDYAHNNNIAFISADSYGLFAHVFTDFGPNHTVYDSTGEEPSSAIVTIIHKPKELTPEEIDKGVKPVTVINTHDEKPHGFGSGDYVQFSEVKGMDEINYKQDQHDESSPLAAVKVVNVLGLYGFEVELDSTKFSPYISHGIVTGVKVEERVASDPFSESLKRPGEFIITDFAKFGRAEQFHFGYQALLVFAERHHGERPRTGSKEEEDEFMGIVVELSNAAKAESEKEEKENEESKRMESEGGAAVPKEQVAKKRTPIHKLDEVDEKLLRQIAVLAQGELNPMATFLGGVVAQEVLKVTGKFKPIKQWLHFDSLECLPAEEITDRQVLDQEQARYGGQIAVFGNRFQQKLADLKLFLVGAGALGCEFCKNFSMMGVATGSDGILYLTDMDNIEKSNLSRQFLFREGDIGKMKSACAARAVKKMNDKINIKSSEVPVGVETEETWTDPFWASLDLVVNALDNIKARLYVDDKCVENHKPLLESGTQGTKANSQVILPRKTESYASSRDPPDQGIPMCTLKNFPHQIEHTIEWARDKFQGFFNNAFEDANMWLKGDELIKQIDAMQAPVSQRERLSQVVKLLEMFEGITFEKCVAWARLQFQDLFYNTIEQLLFNFPKDAKTSNGTPFWSGPKRAPQSIQFDPEDETHLGFVIATANILAYNFNVSNATGDPLTVKKILHGVEVPQWKPRSGIRIKAEDNDSTTEGSEDDDQQVKLLKDKLSSMPKSHYKNPFSPAHFEKDEDTNYHVSFMTNASNLRAFNYSIPPADFQKTKKIAGRIIPAIATTTAMITGLVSLELYKIVQAFDMDKFRNSFINLALPSFVQSEPMPCVVNKSDPKKMLKCYPEGWTLWDSFVIDEGDLTFQQLIDVFKSKHGMVPISISCGKALIYNPILPTHKERMAIKISEWVKTKVDSYTIKPSDKYIALVMLVEDPEDELLNVEIPDPVKFVFRK